jgi:gas vesicle protein
MTGTQDSNNKKNTLPDPAGYKHLFVGVLAGQLVGLTAALGVSHAHIHTHLHVILASTLTGGILGAFAAAVLKPKPPSDAKEEPLRTFTFHGLIETASQKIREMKVDEEFNSASGSGSGQGPRQEQKAQPKLTPPAPPPPGMMGR